MFQKFMVVGNLGADPEMRYTPSGTAYTKFSVATSRKWKDGAGVLQEETTWFRVVVWGKQAEVCNEHLAKGAKVLVEGDRVAASAYLNKDNQPAASLELTGQKVIFLSPRGSAQNGARSEAPAEEYETDELPF